MPAYISAIGTAVPEYRYEQREIADFMIERLQLKPYQASKLRALYRATGIKTRYSVLPDYNKRIEESAFYPKTPDMEPFPTVASRMKSYESEAVQLSTLAAENCLSRAGNPDRSGITHLITVSCTGMYAPGLDIDLVHQLNLPYTVQRTGINFMGCYAAFNALKVARSVVEADATSRVLVVCTELCTLHFQKETDDDNLLAGAIFGDGSAALLVSGAPIAGQPNLEMVQQHCDLLPQGRQDMAWRIRNFGFEMKLSAYVPDLLQEGLQGLLKKLSLPEDDPADYYAVHPGGKRILKVIEEQLGISREENRFAHQVLQQFGNMSSPTILFVLGAMNSGLSRADHGKRVLSLAFGPGLTLESLVFNIAYA